MTEMMDAIVMGGGPGGATAGLMLARAGWRVAVIEKARFPRRKVCGEYLSSTNFPLLRRLGVAEEFLKRAGPPVQQTALFARDTVVTAPLPRTKEMPDGWGRAVGREVLDTLLLERAAQAGAQVRQPWAATKVEKRGDMFLCEATSKETRQTERLCAPTVIGAHGSWEPGTLPTQPARRPARASDLLGFKAHFCDCSLPNGVMPLLIFPGGYGGMAQTNDGRVVVSYCIRRDELERARRAVPGRSAAEAVSSRVRESCRGAREALARARQDGPWLSVGPIRPGVRAWFSDGIFYVGNAAAEAHPIIGEGISMAMQSAWLLCEGLFARGRGSWPGDTLGEIGREYARAWRKSFLPRLRAAEVFAQLAMRPIPVALLVPLFRSFPPLVTLMARWSGKARQVVPSGKGVPRSIDRRTDQPDA